MMIDTIMIIDYIILFFDYIILYNIFRWNFFPIKWSGKST